MQRILKEKKKNEEKAKVDELIKNLEVSNDSFTKDPVIRIVDQIQKKPKKSK